MFVVANLSSFYLSANYEVKHQSLIQVNCVPFSLHYFQLLTVHRFLRCRHCLFQSLRIIIFSFLLLLNPCPFPFLPLIFIRSSPAVFLFQKLFYDLHKTCSIT